MRYKSSGAEASEGLSRVAAAMTARGAAELRQRAAGLEAQERWGEAMEAYDKRCSRIPRCSSRSKARHAAEPERSLITACSP